MKFDGVVVGGGPAGMFAAITAARRGEKVLLLEKNDRLGKKLLITGKGRCNVTNNCTSREVLENIPRNGKFLFSALQAFPPASIISFLESHGCPTKTERGNRVFPVSDASSSVLGCLKEQLHRSGVTVRYERALEILTDSGSVVGVRTENSSVDCGWVILATGGLSYPATGSTGDGFRIAAALGHHVTPLEGSLVPLETRGDDCPRMQGLSLRNVGVKLVDAKGKILYKDFGEMLFTHFGVSGPTVLSASAHMKGEGCKLCIDLKPALDESKLNERVLRDLEQYQNRSMENALTDLLPRAMIPVILDRIGVDHSLQANSLRKEQRRSLIQLMKCFPLEILGKRPVEEAIITSGGIRISQIDPKTLGSKLISGLYFAGEIIDCDAYTGGFNLQIAWATAFAAGSAVKNEH